MDTKHTLFSNEREIFVWFALQKFNLKIERKERFFLSICGPETIAVN